MNILKPLILVAVTAIFAPQAMAAVSADQLAAFEKITNISKASDFIPADSTGQDLQQYVQNWATRNPTKAVRFALVVANKFVKSDADGNKFNRIVDGLLTLQTTDYKAVARQMLQAQPGFYLQLVNAFAEKNLASNEASDVVRAMVTIATETEFMGKNPNLVENVFRHAINKGLLKHPEDQALIQSIINLARNRNTDDASVSKMVKFLNDNKKFVPSYS